ncbi:MAG: AAA family ATPase [Pseudomonadota bacterium]
MRLRRLELARYGRFTDGVIDLGARRVGAPDLHILFGPNESGKSTAFSAWLDLLFGMRERHPYAFRHEWRRLRVAAVLEAGGRETTLVRVGARGRDLLDAEDRPADPMALTSRLHGLTRESYRLMLSLDEESLRQGGEAILASEGDLGRMLFSAAAGLSHLSDRLSTLRAEAAAFHAPLKRKSALIELRARLKALKDEQVRLDTRVAEYRRLTEAFEAADAATAEARATRDAAAEEVTVLERLARGHAAAARLAAAEQALGHHPPAPALPPGMRAEVEKLRVDHAAQRTAERVALKAREDGLAAQAALARDPAILAVAAQVSALADVQAIAVKAAADLPKREAELAEAEAAIETLLREMGAPVDATSAEVEIAPPTLQRLDDLSAASRGLQAASQQAEAELARAEAGLGEAEAAAERFGISGDAPEGPDDPNALAALRDRLRELAPEARLEAGSSALGAATEAETAALAELHPWEGAAEALLALPVPDAAALKAWREKAAAIASAEEALAGLSATQRAATAAAGSAKEAAATVAEDAGREEAAALGRLAPFDGSAEALHAQVPPRAEDVTAWVEEERRLTEATRALTERRDGQAEEAAEAAAARDALAADPATVTEDALTEAKAAREAAWSAHLSALDAESAARFRAALDDLDALVERRLAGAERSARHAEAARRAGAATASAGRAAERLDALRAEAAALADVRAPVLAALGLPAAWSAAALSGWLADREAAVAVLLQQSTLRERADGIAATAEAERLAAADALAAAEEALEARRRALADRVGTAARALGLPAETGREALERWLERREDALADIARRQRAAAEHALAERAAVEVARDVVMALGADGDAVPEGLPLRRLAERLQTRVDWRAARARETRAAREALQANTREVERRRADVRAATEALASWRADWDGAREGLWIAGDDPAAFRVRLPFLRDLPAARRLAAEIGRRIKRMRDDIARQEAARAGLAAGLELDGDGEASGAAALGRRLEAAHLAEDRHATLAKAVEKAGAEAAEAGRALAAIAARVAEHTARFPAPDEIASPEALAAAVAAAEARAEAAQRVSEAEARLLEVLGVGDRAAAEAMLGESAPEVLDERRAAAGRALSEAEALLEERLARRRDAERALEEIGGDARAAALATERQTVLLEVEEGARRAISAHLGAMAAERAIALYRQRHRSAMLADSAAAFRAMTLGSFADLATQPDGKGGERLIAMRAAGAAGDGPASVEVSGLTTGTRAQLYLALRVAAYARFCAAAGPLPFVADDILETFDDERAVAALGQMAAMAGEGQVIYFTHHRHLCALAEEALGDRVRVHAMPD